MSALPTPKIVDLDDPLKPRPATESPRAARPSSPRAAPRRAKPKSAAASSAPATKPQPSLAEEPMAAIFARVPESLTDRLAETVLAINAGRPRRARVSQQDVLGALLHHSLTPGDVSALAEHVDAYRRLLRP